MEPREIKGIGGLVTYDGATIKIKHRMMGWVSAPIHQVIGADLKLARGPFSGKLTIATMSSMHSGMMPKHPWAIEFTYKQAADFQWLHEQLMAVIRR
jgi:hypothetical protein